METKNCWQCGSTINGDFICQQCSSVQPPPTDYFEFFGVPRKLSLDPADLQQRFYRLSRLLHPDRYTRKSAREQQYSLDATAVLNDGFRVLRDPVRRAEYVLAAAGLDISEQRGKNVPPELLEEVFELNMALEELREGDQAARPQLEGALQHFQDLQSGIDSQLEALFAQYDEKQDRSVLEEIRGVLNRRRYIRNLIKEVEKELVPAA
jgi:molecular chaperone HscB